MTMTPQNPIQQFTPQTVKPEPQKVPANPQKKGHTVWWVLGSCCAVLIIALLVLVVVGVAYRGRLWDFAQKLSGNAENTVSNVVTYQNTVVDNTVSNTTASNTPVNNTTSNTTTNTTTPSNTTTTPSSGEKNVLASAVVAKGVDTKTGSSKDVTSAFSSSDEIYYVVLEVSNLEKTDLSVDWFQNDEKIQTYSLKDASGNKFVNFYLDVSGSDADARVGDYQAKVYFGTTLKKTLTFSVSK